MHRHPDIGRQLLEQAGGIFHPLASIVGTHHERWDGRGYPNGVAKDEIPLGARILAVVDSYDAMTSPRVYKRDPLSTAQARAELQRCAESQFDPSVVEAFLQVLEEQEKALLEKVLHNGSHKRPITAPKSTPQQRLCGVKTLDS